MSEAEEKKQLDVEPALDELVCAMCTDTFKEPRSLKCLHCYCEKCLESLAQRVSSLGIVVCPECGEKTTLPPGGVQELPSNSKLRRSVETLTADQHGEILKHQSKTQPLICQQHDNKPLEFYCEPCKAVVCGQCLIDEHKTHGDFKYASDVLGVHISELQKILPIMQGVLESGENALQDMTRESSKLDASLGANTADVNAYFSNLHEILTNAENGIVRMMTLQAKKNKKGLKKLVTSLDKAIDAMKKTKITVEQTIKQHSEKISVLLKENELRVRIQASMKLVEEEMQACKNEGGGLSIVAPFTPDPSVEAACSSIKIYRSNSPMKRSLTVPDEISLSSNAARERSDLQQHFRPTNMTISEQPTVKKITSSSVYNAAKYTSLNIVQPVFEVGTKNLIGSYNAVTAYPFGVACTENGVILVTDTRQHLYRVLTSTGKCLETVGMEGKGDGHFTEPTGITVDPDGNVLVLDGKNPGRMQKFTPSGKYVTKYRARSLLNPTLSIAEPMGVALLANQNILVTDAARACIHEFEAGGKHCGKFGNVMDFKSPAGIAASHDRVVVADQDNHSFYILTELGQLLKKVGKQGTTAGYLHTPFGVTLDSHGNIFVSECGNHRISVFSAGGALLCCFGCEGSQLGMFRTPRHLCFTPQGTLVVSDEQNQRLQLFDLTDTLASTSK